MTQEKNIARFTATDDTGATLHFSADTEIMDYIEPARAFGAGDLADESASTRYQPRLIALPDRRLAPLWPMVLSLERLRSLALVRRSLEGSAGWERIDLSRQLSPAPASKVVAFGAACAEGDDRITLALALSEPDAPGHSRICIAYDVSSEHDDWSALPWVDYGRAPVMVDGIRVWRDTGGVWMIALSGSDGEHQRPYLIRSDRPRSFADSALVFSPAADLKDILDYRAGAWHDALPDEETGVDSILHVLGQGDGGSRLLYARPIAFDAAGRPQATSTYMYRCPQDATVLALGRDIDPATFEDDSPPGADLYVGGAGVSRLAGHRLVHQERAQWETVIAPTLPSPVRRLLAAERSDGDVTLWALLDDGQLVAVRRAAPDAAWGTPLFLRKDVIDIAPSAGDAHQSASVLLVYQGGDAAHLWRDTGGVWQEAVIHTPDPNDAASVTCFGTTFTAQDADGVARVLLPVRIRASVPSSLVINGQHHYVGPQLAVTVPTSATGALVIFNRAMSFTPATYRLELDGMAQAIDVNPATCLYDRLDHLTAAELRTAKAPGGEGLLLAPAYGGPGHEAALDALLGMLRRTGELARAGHDAAPGVRMGAADAPFSSAMSASGLRDGYGWGVRREAGGALSALAAPALPPLPAVAAARGDSIADVLQGIWDNVGVAASYIVRKAGDLVEFVCEIGGAIKRWVVTGIEALGDLAGRICEAIAGGVDKLITYYKFLYNWEDILTVGKVMAESARKRLDAIETHVAGIRDSVAAAFDGALVTIEARAAAWQVTPGTPIERKPVAKPLLDCAAVRDRKAQNLLASGEGGWLLDQLAKLRDQVVTVTPEDDNEDEAGPDELLEDMDDVLKVLSKDLGQDFTRIFGDGEFRLADVDLDKLQRLVLAVSIRVARAATQALKLAALTLLDALGGIIRMFRRTLFATVRFPFLEKMVGMLAGRDVDLSFRIVDALLLIPAALTTLSCKLVGGDRFAAAVVRVREDMRKQAQHGVLAKDKAWALPPREDALVNSIAVVWVGFATTLKKSASAYDQVNLQKASGFTGYLSLGWDVVVHVFIDAAALVTSSKPAAAIAADTALYLTGLAQTMSNVQKVRMGPKISVDTIASFGTALATVHLVCGVLKVVFKSASHWAQDSDKRDDWAYLGYCSATSASALLSGAKLNPEPESKTAMVAGAVAAHLALGVGPGVYRASLAYDGSDAGMPAAA